MSYTADGTIHDLVRTRRADLGLSLRDVAKKAVDKGFELTQTAVSDYERGKSKPREDKVTALAAGLSIRPGLISRAIANTPDPESQAELPEYVLLNADNQTAVRAFASALLASQRRTEELAETIADVQVVTDIVETAINNGEVSDEDDPKLTEAMDRLKRTRKTTEEQRRTA